MRSDQEGVTDNNNRDSRRQSTEYGELILRIRRGLFLRRQVADVVIIQVHIHKRTQLGVRGKQVVPQLRKVLGQLFQSAPDSRSGDLYGLLTARIGAQRRGDVNLHCYPLSVLSISTASVAFTSTTSFTNALSSSLVPVSRNEFVVTALPFSTLVMMYEHPIQWASEKSVLDHCAG